MDAIRVIIAEIEKKREAKLKVLLNSYKPTVNLTHERKLA
jgi:hypothetical protein